MIDQVLFAKALADETRQKIMAHLCCNWLSVNDIVDKLGGEVSQPTVSHHLKILNDAKLLDRRKEGKQVYNTLNQERVSVCCGQLMLTFAPEVPTLAADAIEVEAQVEAEMVEERIV